MAAMYVCKHNMVAPGIASCFIIYVDTRCCTQPNFCGHASGTLQVVIEAPDCLTGYRLLFWDWNYFKSKGTCHFVSVVTLNVSLVTL